MGAKSPPMTAPLSSAREFLQLYTRMRNLTEIDVKCPPPIEFLKPSWNRQCVSPTYSSLDSWSLTRQRPDLEPCLDPRRSHCNDSTWKGSRRSKNAMLTPDSGTQAVRVLRY